MNKNWLLLGFALVAGGAIHAQNAIGEVYSTDASVRGSVALSGTGTRVLSGSQIAAGDGAALLRLERGGDVRICPKTNLTLSSDASGKALVLGLNTGAMELDYSLGSSADMLLTPDFRMQLISPGTFHLAISVATSGDTCIRTMAGDDAAVFVTEMMGNDSYQLSPGKSVMFKAGKISGATEAPADCGCKELQRTASLAEPVVPPAPAVASAPAPTPPAAKNATEPQLTEPHLEVESSFVYRGKQTGQDYYASVARLSLSRDNSQLALALLPKVSGPQETVKPEEKKPGLLHRLGRFLQRLFGK